MAKRIYLNLDLCCGCESCAAACFYSHWHEQRVEHGEIKAKGQANLPLHCLHCEQPACVAACPNQAMQKDEDGVVRRSSFKCVGCKSCAAACPFGVIDHNLIYHIVPKCDLCTDRLKEDGIPRCVAACTSKALSFEEEDKVTLSNKKVQLSHRILSNFAGRRR